ncbi:MAG: hypothetical protein AAB403_20660 [Planctomycetota bacterium]
MRDPNWGSPEEAEEPALDAVREDIWQDLRTAFVPCYVRLLRLSRGFSIAELFGRTLFLGFLVHMLIRTLGFWDDGILNLWSLYILPLLMWAEFFLPAAGYRALVDAAPRFLELPAELDGLNRVRVRLKEMCRGRGQWVLSVVLSVAMAFGHGMLRKQQMLPVAFQQLSMPVFVSGCALNVLAAFVAGWGLWFGITMIYVVAGFKGLHKLRLNPVAPGETVGLRWLERVAGIYSLYYSFGLLILGFPVLFMPWQGQKGVVFWLLVYLIPLLLSGVLVLSLLYPIWAFSGMVRDGRDRSLLRLEKGTRLLLVASLTSGANKEIADQLWNLLSVQKEILQSSSGVPRLFWSTRAISALVLQVPLALQWLERAKIRSLSDLMDRVRQWVGVGP